MIRCDYRRAKPVPTQLLHNASICIREHLHSDAFALLHTVLIAGTGTEVPASIPPASYLAFAITLIIHPRHTTRTRIAEKQAASDEALKYLRHVVSIVGAVNAGFNKAFVFNEKEDELRTRRKENRQSGIVVMKDDDETPQLDVTLATKQSIWRRAEDFWGIVGWAFNCAVLHKHRWKRWRLWLELMCDILEGDLEERVAQANDLWVEDEEKAGALLRESLMAQYLSGLGEGRGSKRRIVRAVLAGGRQKSAAEFKEIWENETALPKVQLTHEEGEAAKKKRKLDLEHGEYGDYFDHDDSSSEEDTLEPNPKRSTRLSGGKRRKNKNTPVYDSENNSISPDQAGVGATPESPGSKQSTLEAYGGIQALHLRRRFLRLLALYTTLLPSPESPAHFTDTETLFEIYVEALRDLPLPIFTYFALPIPIPSPIYPSPSSNTTAAADLGCLTQSWLEPEALSFLLQVLLRPLLSSQAPVHHLNGLTSAGWMKYHAPWQANLASVTENARVSLCTEGLARLLRRTDRTGWDALREQGGQLKGAVEEGIRARRKKAGLKVNGKEGEARSGWGGRLGKKEDEDAAVRVLEGSERRLRALAGV